ncbi:phage minor head protein [Streptomyces sp. NPDC088847]|uniref:phage minor head protein n=1 Tax=Streptomyces sp. NPDC088847 TaxID=3365909 RepID=UPI00381D6D64
MADWETALAAAEDDAAEEVAAVLDDVAEEFARGLENATEIVAARFSVARIAGMWSAHVPRMVRRFLGIAETAATDAADSVGETLPDGWDDLPGRYDDDTLPASLGDYVDTTEHLLRAVGDDLSARAVKALAAGLDAGEDVDALRARLRAMFSREEGAQLGPGREERIARTEASRAWNSSTLAAAQDMSGEDRPLVKQWRTRGDTKVRESHDKVDGQLRFLDEPFKVGGRDMMQPGDPTAPAEEVVNCRCVLRLERAPARASALPSEGGGSSGIFDLRGFTLSIDTKLNPDSYRLLHGIDAAEKISDGLVRPALRASGVPYPERYSLGWDMRPLPGVENRFPYGAEVSHPETITAAADDEEPEHTGAMIALVPSDEDAERLALDDGEPVDELHLTLWYLGEGAPWTEDQRNELIGLVRERAAALAGPVVGRAFGVNHWNPQGDEPVWVWAVSDERDHDGPTLEDAHRLAVDALESTHERPETPAQHTPWVPHVTGGYTAERWPLDAMADRLGPITFDRIRLAFAGEVTDIPLGPEEEPPMEPTAAAETTAEEPYVPPVRAWSTPGDAALAFENQQTGDGRIFAPSALYWDGAGPWPLQYADEMLMGHQGAELAGSINSLGRDGDRIPGDGVLYLTQRAGWEAVTLLEQEAPLGVSVDLDDVDVEFVDKTLTEDEDGFLVLAASVPSLSALQLADGAWCLTASNTTGMTASSHAGDDSASFLRERRTSQLITGPGGTVAADALRQFAASRVLTAAAGDADNPDEGIVIHSESSGDFLVRITRARVRGATLVSMPAYANARIVLDVEEETAAAVTAATGPTDKHHAVVHYVATSPIPVGPREVSKALGMALETARGYLNRAVSAGRLVRMAMGLYKGASTIPEGPYEVTAAGADPSGFHLFAESELLASAWTAMRELPPMPAAWFAEPTEDELPIDSGGVHFKAGRIFGWVARSGEPHAGYPGKSLTIEKLARQGLDTTHFLRARFKLDDGSFVRAGAFTMNTPHRRDGAECEDEVCQFDDTRTVAGIVTVGYNARGLWFAGAMAPWLSDWDRTVFMGCQPSYHLKQDAGKWQLRAVLSVPVPGHSTPLVAAAIERGNLALCASYATSDVSSAPTDEASVRTPDGGSVPVDGTSASVDRQGADQHGHRPSAPSAPVDGSPSGADLVEAVASVLVRPDVLDALAAALVARSDAKSVVEAQRRAEIDAMAADLDLTEPVTASAGTAPKGQS